MYAGDSWLSDQFEVPGVVIPPREMLAGERREPSKKVVGLEVVFREREGRFPIEPMSKGPGISGMSSIFVKDIVAHGCIWFLQKVVVVRERRRRTEKKLWNS